MIKEHLKYESSHVIAKIKRSVEKQPFCTPHTHLQIHPQIHLTYFLDLPHCLLGGLVPQVGMEFRYMLEIVQEMVCIINSVAQVQVHHKLMVSQI